MQFAFSQIQLNLQVLANHLMKINIEFSGSPKFLVFPHWIYKGFGGYGMQRLCLVPVAVDKNEGSITKNGKERKRKIERVCACVQRGWMGGYG